jgi:hypothetical protein
MLLGIVHTQAIAFLLMLFIGFNWVIIPTNFNVATQRSVPNWVKGRALAMYMTTLFGSWAIGSAIWGTVAKQTSISTALLLAGGLMIAGLLVFSHFRLTMNLGNDLTPAFTPAHLPAAPTIILLPTGYPEYHVKVQWPAHKGFSPHSHDVRELRRQRLRNGAQNWELKRQDSPTAHWLETFSFRSDKEFSQHHARTTKADLRLQESLKTFAPEPTPAPPTPPMQHPFAIWLSNRFFWCANRTLEEAENVIKRLDSQAGTLP